LLRSVNAIAIVAAITAMTVHRITDSRRPHHRSTVHPFHLPPISPKAPSFVLPHPHHFTLFHHASHAPHTHTPTKEGSASKDHHSSPTRRRPAIQAPKHPELLRTSAPAVKSSNNHHPRPQSAIDIATFTHPSTYPPTYFTIYRPTYLPPTSCTYLTSCCIHTTVVGSVFALNLGFRTNQSNAARFRTNPARLGSVLVSVRLLHASNSGA